MKFEIVRPTAPTVSRDDASLQAASSASVEHFLNVLRGVVLGIIADGKIDDGETFFLQNWRIKRSTDAEKPELKPIFAVLDAVLADGVLTLSEAFELLAAIDLALQRESKYRPEIAVAQTLKGFAQGVASDSVLTPDEIRSVAKWFDRLTPVLGDLPQFGDVADALDRANRDYSQENVRKLLQTIEDFAG